MYTKKCITNFVKDKKQYIMAHATPAMMKLFTGLE